MGLQEVPAYIGQAGFQHPVELDRNIVEALTGNRSGFFRYGDFALTPTVGSLAMNIAAGRGVVLGNESGFTGTQGSYFFWSDDDEDVSWPSPSGSPRIDALLVQVHDPQYGTISGDPRVEWRIVTGTPSGSPVAPTDALIGTGGGSHEPGAWFRVADVLINPSDTVINPANITSYAQYVKLGHKVLVRTAITELTDGTFEAGDVAHSISTGREWTYRHTASFNGWVPTFPRPVVIMERAAAQSVTTGGSGAQIGWDSEIDDIFALYGGSGAFTIPTGMDGLWEFDIWMRADSINTTGIRTFQLYYNGGALGPEDRKLGMPASAGVNIDCFHIHVIKRVAVGDTMTALFFQNSGSTQVINVSAGFRPRMHCTFLGP